MSAGWIGFIGGLVVGLPAGMALLSLCVIAKRSEQDMDQIFNCFSPPDKPVNTKPPRLPR
jgi:hypothetical protein